MRKSIFIAYCTIFIFFFLGCASIANAVGESAKFSLAHIFPIEHFMNRELIKPWTKEVKKASGGSVIINKFPVNKLVKSAEMYEGVVRGKADIGVGAFGFRRNRFPVMEGFELPGVYYGSATATNLVARDGYKKFKPKELSDTKLMFLYSVGPGFLYSNKKVSSLEDLEGMRIRALGLTAKSIEALGAVPVSMPMPGVYEALSKGGIEGMIGPPEVLKGWKMAKVTKYITILPPVYNSLHFMVMNLKTWNTLPGDIQMAIEAINESYYIKAGQIWDRQMKKKGIDYGIKRHGMKMGRLSEDDSTKAMVLLQPIQDDYVDRMNIKGLPGQEILDFAIEKAAVYSKQYNLYANITSVQVPK